VVAVSRVCSFDGWDHYLSHKALQAVISILGVSPFGIGVCYTVAIGGSHHKRLVSCGDPGIQIRADTLGKHILGFAWRAVQHVEYRKCFSVRGVRPVNPHLPLVP
jgi:hypothetical protein